jgi:hypothetical protein
MPKKPDTRPRCAVCDRVIPPNPLAQLLGLPTTGEPCSERCLDLMPSLDETLALQQVYACALSHGWVN